MRRAAAWLVLPILCSGCFIFEEIDAGQKIMEKHTPKEVRERREREAAASEAQREEEESRPGLLARLEAWWEEYERDKAREDRIEAARAAEDPSDTIVSCRIGSQTQFTRKSDCQARGGTFRER